METSCRWFLWWFLLRIVMRSRRTHKFRNWISSVLSWLSLKENVSLKLCFKSGIEAHSKATVTRLPQDDRFSSLFGSYSFSQRLPFGIASAAIRRYFVCQLYVLQQQQRQQERAFTPAEDEMNATHGRRIVGDAQSLTQLEYGMRHRRGSGGNGRWHALLTKLKHAFGRSTREKKVRMDHICCRSQTRRHEHAKFSFIIFAHLG